MSADRVRTGMISSVNNALQIDLDNGTITAPSITLSGQDLESTIDSLVQTSVVTRYALSNSGTMIPSAFPLTNPTQPTEQQPYLWARTVYTYADGQENTSYTVSVRGANGQNGADGKDGVDGKDGADGKNGADGKDANASLAQALAIGALALSAVLLIGNIVLFTVVLPRMKKH
jgi:hypothetical protein